MSDFSQDDKNLLIMLMEMIEHPKRFGQIALKIKRGELDTVLSYVRPAMTDRTEDIQTVLQKVRTIMKTDKWRRSLEIMRREIS